MPSQKPGSNRVGMPHSPPQPEGEDRFCLLKFNALPEPQHSGDPAEQFVLCNGQVFLGQCVAAGSDKVMRVDLDRADNAMSTKMSVAREKSDVPRPHTRGGLPQNQKSVTRKD